MEISAKALACFVYDVPPEAILAAAYRPDGGLTAVIDRGIHGAPKYTLSAQATARAKTEFAKREPAREGTAQRDTFTNPPIPQPSQTSTKSKRAAKVKQGA